MRILLAAQFFPPVIGGEERHVFNLASELVARGHEVAVATQATRDDSGSIAPPTETLSNGVRIHRLRSSLMAMPFVYSDGSRPHHAPVPDPQLTRALARVVEAEQPEVVHAHNWIVNSVVALPRMGRGRPPFGIALTLHDYSHVCAIKRLMRHGQLCEGPAPSRCLPCAGRHYGWPMGTVSYAGTALMRPVKAARIDHIISVSNAVAQANQVATGKVPSTVIPNFVPDALASGPPADQLPARDPMLPADDFLLFVGDLSADKGVPQLLAAYQLLGENRPPLLLVGRRTDTTPAHLPAGAVMAVEWPHARVVEAFRRCTAAVLPSVWPDPCPTTVLEAMAAGRPVLTTATGGMVDMVTDGVDGMLSKPGDVARLAANMERVVLDPSLRERLGTAARVKVRQFTASSVTARVEEVYRSIQRPSKIQ